VYARASSRQPLVAVKDASALFVVFIFELVAVVSLHCSKQWKGAGGVCLFESKHWGCLDARSAFKFCKNKLFSNFRAWATLSRRRRRVEYDDFSYSRLGGESNEHARRRTRVYNRPQRGKISFRCGVLIGVTAHESADDVVCERGVHALRPIRHARSNARSIQALRPIQHARGMGGSSTGPEKGMDGESVAEDVAG